MKRVHQVGRSVVAIEEVPVPVPGPGEVLIKTAASALCGSEMKTYVTEGLPTGNMGHEAAGLISALGPGVTSLTAGDRVGVSAISGCETCTECLAGRFTWCQHLKFHPNMHAEYFVIPASACHKIPENIPWDVGVLVTGDGLGVPYHSSQKISGSEIKTVTVFGLGPIGLSTVLMQIYLGRRVIGIDRSPDRLAFAQKMGAEVIESKEGLDIPFEIQKGTGGLGADACIEAAGSPVTARLCFSSVRKGGTVVFNGEQGNIEISPSDDLIRRDITAVGSWFYHFSEYPQMLAMAQNGLPVADLITHRLPMDRAGEGFALMAAGKTGKVILEY